jgi:integrase
MRRMGLDAVPHGFRSTFRDWAAERTNYPREVCEMALAHTVAEGAEAAYWRSDLFDKRRRMMDEWAAFLARIELPAQVIELQARRV